MRLLYALLVAVTIMASGVDAAAPKPAKAKADSEVRLTADNMQFNPENEEITASGNVHLIKGGADIKGHSGRGSVNGNTFRLDGNVVGVLQKDNIRVACDTMIWTSGQGTTSIVEATGRVRLERRRDRISANFVRWTVGASDKYTATGGVVAVTAEYRLEAEEAGRDGRVIWAKNVKRYEDPRQGIVISAAKMNGLIGDDGVSEMNTSGNVKALVTGARGEIIEITGSEAVYSLERGTVVVSGGATAIQPGRRVAAETMVMYLDTRRIEASGNPEITFTEAK